MSFPECYIVGITWYIAFLDQYISLGISNKHLRFLYSTVWTNYRLFISSLKKDIWVASKSWLLRIRLLQIVVYGHTFSNHLGIYHKLWLLDHTVRLCSVLQETAKRKSSCTIFHSHQWWIKIQFFSFWHSYQISELKYINLFNWVRLFYAMFMVCFFLEWAKHTSSMESSWSET